MVGSAPQRPFARTTSSGGPATSDDGPAPLSLSDFLVACQTTTRRGRPQQQLPPTHQPHVVIGNEAGDADSIVSAIALAYVDYLHATAARSSDSSSNNDDDTITLTPVISIPRADFETQRPETVLLLRLAGVVHTTESLVFVDDPSLFAPPTTAAATPLHVTLVDHNRLSSALLVPQQQPPDAPSFPALSATTVMEILDHHMDEGQHLDCQRRNIAYADGAALVASTCTLVAERLLHGIAAPPPPPAPLALLLLGVILLDSINLAPAAGKATPRDAAAVRALLERTDWQAGLCDEARRVLQLEQHRPNPTALFDALQSAKFAPAFWKSLTVRDALRLDYKNFAYDDETGASFGVSTVLLSLDDFFATDGVVQGMCAYREHVNVDLLGVMLASTTTDGSLRRELALAASDNVLVDDLVQFLQIDGDDSLQITEAREAIVNGNVKIRCFAQGNAKASRKQVAPALLRFFDKSFKGPSV